MQYHGIAGSAGIAIGKAFLLRYDSLVIPEEKIAEDEVTSELEKLCAAMEKTKQDITAIKNKAFDEYGADKANIFEAHSMMLEDEMLADRINDNIRSNRMNAAAAVQDAIEFFAQMFDVMEDEYMRERAQDVRDVGSRLVKNVLGISTLQLDDLESEVIIIAHDLTPSDTAMMKKQFVLGFATDIGGRTSHTAIIARTLGIPAILGINDISQHVVDGDVVIIDGDTGTVIINPSAEELACYRQMQSELVREKERLYKLISVPAETPDGHKVELAANIGNPRDLDKVLEVNAQGIGLYRTEFLYMDRDNLPTEEEQFEAYKIVAQAMGQEPVIIRTLDIGGDKTLPYLDLPHEANPFLGFRAIRVCLEKIPVFKVQLRAILRASAFGNIKIMYPMISSIDEIMKANAILSEVKAELTSEKKAFNDKIAVGIMIEIPSAAVIADLLAPHVDFFSIGTNDLCQYTLAVDRLNQHVGNYYQPMHPAVIRLIKHVIDAAHQVNKPVGMCGEMAGDPLAAVLLLGLGLDEFSMSASSILAIKEIIRTVTYEQAQQIAGKTLTMNDSQTIVSYLKDVMEKNKRRR